MQLHPVKGSLDGQTARLGEFLQGVRDLGLGHGLGFGVRLHALGIGPHLARAHTTDRTEHPGAGRQVGLVRHAAGVHELHHDLAALSVHGVGHQLPALNLLVVVEPGDAGIAQAIGRRRGALRDDEAGRGPLLVVGGHQGVGGGRLHGAAAGHGVHDGAVGQRERAQRKRFKQHEGSFDGRVDEKRWPG